MGNANIIKLKIIREFNTSLFSLYHGIKLQNKEKMFEKFYGRFESFRCKRMVIYLVCKQNKKLKLVSFSKGFILIYSVVLLTIQNAVALYQMKDVNM